MQLTKVATQKRSRRAAVAARWQKQLNIPAARKLALKIGEVADHYGSGASELELAKMKFEANELQWTKENSLVVAKKNPGS
eukprot:GSA25T00022165001.1